MADEVPMNFIYLFFILTGDAYAIIIRSITPKGYGYEEMFWTLRRSVYHLPVFF